jgi:hypothetical protein
MRAATPSADESAVILTGCLKRREPFFFIRYGDGAIECIYEEGGGRTCDGEVYSHELGLALLDAWARLERADTTVFAGDWQSATFGRGSGHNREEERWQALAGGAPFRWLHFETLLLMRESAVLVDFYRTVKADTRRKVYMGPAKNASAARFLGASHLITPMVANLHSQIRQVTDTLEMMDFDILLYGAGMAGNVAAVESWSRHRDRTYISLGSALDPLFSGKTRTQQLPQSKLQAMFRPLL